MISDSTDNIIAEEHSLIHNSIPQSNYDPYKYQKLQIHSAHSIISSDNDYENDPAFSGLFLGNSKNMQNPPVSKSAYSNTLANLDASISQPSINGSQSVILHIDEIKKRQIDKSPVIFEDKEEEPNKKSRDVTVSSHEPSIENSPEIPNTLEKQKLSPKLLEKTEYQCWNNW